MQPTFVPIGGTSTFVTQPVDTPSSEIGDWGVTTVLPSLTRAKADEYLNGIRAGEQELLAAIGALDDLELKLRALFGPAPSHTRRPNPKREQFTIRYGHYQLRQDHSAAARQKNDLPYRRHLRQERRRDHARYRKMRYNLWSIAESQESDIAPGYNDSDWHLDGNYLEGIVDGDGWDDYVVPAYPDIDSSYVGGLGIDVGWGDPYDDLDDMRDSPFARSSLGYWDDDDF